MKKKTRNGKALTLLLGLFLSSLMFSCETINKSKTEDMFSRETKILQSNPELQKLMGPENASFVAFALAVVVGVAAFVWAITVTHVMAGNVVAVGTFHVYAAATTWSWKINHSITPNHDYLTQNNATIDIWLLKSNDLSNLGIIIDKKLICI